mmetsp:Transcript_50653/g.142471  ORF Transcript_50653/g.142471 Transcript_50653/m.142471 type:complete len:259 (-) Transcript_50653:636-1412(-)
MRPTHSCGCSLPSTSPSIFAAITSISSSSAASSPSALAVSPPVSVMRIGTSGSSEVSSTSTSVPNFQPLLVILARLKSSFWSSGVLSSAFWVLCTSSSNDVSPVFMSAISPFSPAPCVTSRQDERCSAPFTSLPLPRMPHVLPMFRRPSTHASSRSSISRAKAFGPSLSSVRRSRAPVALFTYLRHGASSSSSFSSSLIASSFSAAAASSAALAASALSNSTFSSLSSQSFTDMTTSSSSRSSSSPSSCLTCQRPGRR